MQFRKIAAIALFLTLAFPSVRVSSQASADQQTKYVSAPAKAHHFDRSVAAIHRVTLKASTKYWRYEHLSLDRKEAETQLRHWLDEGIDALEIFAPSEGGNSYNGLDAIDRYQLEPGQGIDDFRWLVAKAHELGMAVIAFDNLGYSSVYATQFLKACDDVRAGRSSREARMFLWSTSADAPFPARSNSYFFVRPDFKSYDASKTEFWQWDERCQHFYWTRWRGKDKDGNLIHLPQYNWIDNEWPSEAEKVVHFWMDTGLDGMVIDAVNWYVGYTWEKGNRRITGPIASYGNTFSQPEGGGAFHTDDPVGWSTEGHWTNMYDYGLGIWWEKDNNPLRESVEKGDPGILETALRSYHDRVRAAGSSLYAPVLKMQNADQQRFVEALLATSGTLVCYCSPADEITAPAEGIAPLLKMRHDHPALYLDSARRRIPTQDDAKFYAILRASSDKSERILAVFNFQATAQTVKVDLGAIDGHALVDLLANPPVANENNGHGDLTVTLPAYGYRLYQAR